MKNLAGYVFPLALEESSRARDVEERFVNFMFLTCLSHNVNEILHRQKDQ